MQIYFLLTTKLFCISVILHMGIIYSLASRDGQYQERMNIDWGWDSGKWTLRQDYFKQLSQKGLTEGNERMFQSTVSDL